LLARLNGQAVQCADLSSERGLLLMGAISRSLTKYSAGRHRLVHVWSPSCGRI
jgi:hypothetical protein